MKKFISLVLAVIMVMSVFTVYSAFNAFAVDLDMQSVGKVQSGTCGDNLSWTLDVTTGEFVLSGTGDIPDYSTSDSAPWYDYRHSIKTATLSDGITSIGDNAFYFCTNMTGIKIPNKITSIGNFAFSNCSSLSAVTIPSSATVINSYAFYACTSLRSIAIPDNVKSISNCAFYSCVGLESVTIGKGVDVIYDTAFLDCEKLKNISVDDENKSYSSQAGVLFNKNKTFLVQYPAGNDRSVYEIPATVTKINIYAFYRCQKLMQINADSQNKYFASEDGVLFNKNKTELIHYPIGNRAILYKAPEGVSNIHAEAFQYCTYLKNIVLPSSVREIGNSAFFHCTGLTNINIPYGVKSIGNYAFYSCLSLTSINIPKGVEKIGYNTFYDCSSMKSIKIHSSVKVIEGFSFNRCTALKDVYYIGDEYEWSKIKIEINNAPLTNANIHFMGDYLIGDVDLDKSVTIMDATEIQKYLVQLVTLNDDQMVIADANNDIYVNIIDATTIQKYLAQLINHIG